MRALLTLLVLIATPAVAGSLEVKTGKWETTTITTNSMMPEPVETTTTSCIEQGTYDPEDMMEGADDCDVKQSVIDDNTMNFEMTCLIEGTESTVKGSFHSEGETGKGNMDMSMMMGAMEMTVSTKWTSRYTGPCE